LKTEDFYIENGLYVFTADFHKKRGHCCGSGCRHCPYDKKTGKLLIDNENPIENG
jgi:hypothetical protein